MARHLTWCLKRVIVLTNRLNVNSQSISIQNRTTTTSIQPKFPQIKEIDVDYDEPKGFAEFKDDVRYGIKHAIHALVKILYIDPETAKKAVADYPAFQTLPKKTIYRNFHTLREATVYKSTIKDNKFILAETMHDLRKKLHLLQMLDIDINSAVHLFPLSIAMLASFIDKLKMDATYLPNGSRIRYLAEKFNVDAGAICQLLAFNPFMLMLPAPKLLSVTEYILDAGMSSEHIMQDVHIYRYHIGTIREKVERAKKLDVQPLRPWVIRCPEGVWEKVKEKVGNTESTLWPHKTRQEHLAEVFGCDVATINFVFQKNPNLETAKIEKLSKMAKLLRDEGYGIEHIQRSPRVMHRNYETVLEYFKLMKEYGIENLPLSTLTVSREKFIKVLEKKRRLYTSRD